MKKYTSSDLLLDEQTEEELSIIRSARYQMVKQTHEYSLIQITEAEWVFLQCKANKYEQLTGIDIFDKLVETYMYYMNDKHLLETGMAYSRFIINLNRLLEKDSKFNNKKLHTVDFYSSEHLEKLLGEDATYDGENALIRGYNEIKIDSDLKRVLKTLTPSQAEYLREVIMNNKSMKDVAQSSGYTSEWVRNCCVNGLRKLRHSKNTRILKSYYEVEKEPTSLQELTFVKDKSN